MSSRELGVPTVRVSEQTAAKTAAQWQEIEQESAELLFVAVRRQVGTIR